MTSEVPQAARLIRDFVNTYEPQIAKESLATSAALKDWLTAHHQLADMSVSDTALSDTDLTTVHTVREGLRNILLSHAGHDPDSDAIDALRATLVDLPVRVDFDDGGYRIISTRTDPVGQALGQLLDAVRQSREAGTWARLKVCARDTCRWAFYDASRNQVRRWCSMAGCGNHVKMKRAYAARKDRMGGASKSYS
jgi:predicted RNA-binding Zn ribbon-like protein